MAGSWNHMVDVEGRFLGTKLLENMGDVKEALEECYGMVWWLADQIARPLSPDSEMARELISEQLIEQAQKNYVEGLKVSPSTTYSRRT